VSGAGRCWELRYNYCKFDAIGVDNIFLSVDYPFSANQMGVDFLNEIQLPPEQIAKIAHGNADRVLGF
jgi:hypothetical protein